MYEVLTIFAFLVLGVFTMISGFYLMIEKDKHYQENKKVRSSSPSGSATGVTESTKVNHQ
jgi:hypothetical protein